VAHPDSRRPAILIAESQPELRNVLSCVLRDAAYDTALAADGIEAVSAVMRMSPDLLVLDLHLARLDGLVALEVVRALAQDLPVVLISCLAASSLGTAAERLGAFAVLRKPFRNAELLDAVARGLAQRPGAKEDAAAGAREPLHLAP
jgi:two-component system response regulator AdeR